MHISNQDITLLEKAVSALLVNRLLSVVQVKYIHFSNYTSTIVSTFLLKYSLRNALFVVNLLLFFLENLRTRTRCWLL